MSERMFRLITKRAKNTNKRSIKVFISKIRNNGTTFHFRSTQFRQIFQYEFDNVCENFPRLKNKKKSKKEKSRKKKRKQMTRDHGCREMARRGTNGQLKKISFSSSSPPFPQTMATPIENNYGSNWTRGSDHPLRKIGGIARYSPFIRDACAPWSS